MPAANKDIGLGTIFYGDITDVIRKLGLLSKQMTMMLSRVGTVSAAMNTAAVSTSGMAVASGKTTKAIKKTKDVLDPLGKSIGQVSGGMRRLTAAFKVTAAYGIAVGSIYKVINALQVGKQEIFSVDQALKNIQAITGALDAELGLLRTKILQVASDTKYSASEVSEAVVILGQAGFDAAESVQAIESVSNLATGTLTNMASAADLFTTAIRAFQLDTRDSSRVADIFAGAVNKSKLTIDKLRTSFNYLGPIAHMAGLSLESTAAGAMLLANAGLRASTIGTGFRQVLSRLVDPSEKISLTIRSLGGDLEKLNPATASMSEIMNELNKIMGESVPKAERAKRAFALFGLRGAAVASTFAKAGSEVFEAMLEEVFKVGRAAEMAEKQMEGLEVMSKNLGDKMKVLAVAIGEGGVAGAFRLFYEIARPLVGILAYLADTLIGRVIVGITALTVSITALSLVVRYLIIQMSALAFSYTVATVKMMAAAQGASLLTVGFKALTTAIKGLVAWLVIHPWIAWIAVVAAAGVAILTVIKYTNDYANKLKEATLAAEGESISLRKYKTELDGVKEGSLEYRSTMQRLINAYPDLREEVNLTTMAWEDEGKALDEIIKKTNQIESNTILKAVQSLRRSTKPPYYLGPDLNVIKGIESPEKVAAAKKEIESYAKRLGQVINNTVTREAAIAMSSEGGEDKIGEFISEQWGWSDQAVRRARKDLIPNIKTYFGGVAKDIDEEARKGTDTYKKQQLDVLLSGHKDWQNYFNSLTSEIKKAEVVSEYSKFLDKLADLQKQWDQAGLTSAWKKLLEKKESAEALNRLKRDETEAAKKRTSLRRSLLLDQYDAEGKLREKALEKADQSYHDDIESYRESKKDQAEFMDYLYERQELLVAEKAAINKKYDEKDVADAEKALKKKLGDTEKYSVAWWTIMKEMLDRKLITQYQYDEEEEAAWREKLSKAKAYSAEWVAILTAGYEAGYLQKDELDKKTSEAELRRIKETGTWWEQIKHGMSRAARGGDDFASSMVRIGEQLHDKLGTGIADFFSNIVTGSQNAKEAFANFARSTLNWLTQILIKTLILKAIGYYFGGPAGAAVTSAATAHGGKLPGESMKISRQVDSRSFLGAPRFHSGEIPAIIKKDEAVLTRQQYGKLSGGGGSLIQNNFEGATFLDKQQMTDAMTVTAQVNAIQILKQHGSNTILSDIQNDHPIRRITGGRV